MWASAPVRLTALLACLLLAVAALLDNTGVLSGSDAGAHVPVPLCNGGRAAEAVQPGAAQRAALRTSVLAVFSGRSGKLYESGHVATSNLWTDNEPTVAAGGGFEARWFALDREGRDDNVVADVLRYASAADAERTLALATDARCRRSGSVAGAAAFPAGARTLGWVNPDGAYQRDTLFARGPLLYRVSDVAPSAGSGHAGGTQAVLEHDRASVVTRVLACTFPAAGCPAGQVARAASVVGPPARPLLESAPGWPAGSEQVSAFLDAAAVHAYDLPWMTELLPAGAGASEAGAAPRCAQGLASLLTGTSAHSVTLAYRKRLFTDELISYARMLPSESGATSALAAYRRAVADGCLQRQYNRAVAGSNVRRRVKLGAVHLVTLPTPPPASYVARAPYRALALRVSTAIRFRTRQRRAVRLPYFYESFLFAYKRALIVVSIRATGEPFPQASRQYLESVLVGRAETRWGTTF